MTAIFTGLIIIITAIAAYLFGYSDGSKSETSAKRINELLADNERLQSELQRAQRNDTPKDPVTGRFTSKRLAVTRDMREASGLPPLEILG